MKKLFLILTLVVFCFGMTFAQKSAEKKTKETGKISGKAIQGTVIDLVDYLTGGTGKMTAATVKDAAITGHILALMAGTGKSGKIYLVYKSDGKSATEQLAKLYDKKIAVEGKTVSKSGMNIIMSVNITEVK